MEQGMRPQCRLSAGFVPAPREAIDRLLEFLLPPTEGPCAILDPCCGEGVAALQLAAGLGIDEKSVWLIELDRARGDTCRELMPVANILSPCSALAASVRMGSFSLVYCNPPFDDSLTPGERVEEQFLSAVSGLVQEGGVLVFVCPLSTAERQLFQKRMLLWYGEIKIVPWPSSVRKYGEVFVIARHQGSLGERSWYREQGNNKTSYQLPSTKGPGKKFTKIGMTDDELQEALRESPLTSKLTTTVDLPLPQPPLALGLGHLALLLAAGHLDGLVAPPGELPHVVRGVAKKVPEVVDETVDKTKEKTVTTKTIVERIKLTVRTACADGVIRDLE